MDCMKDGFAEGQLLAGRYRTIAPLNHGSFGMVFLAEDLTTHQEVAIKCLIKPNSTLAVPYAPTADEGMEELACHGILQQHANLVNLLHHFESDAHTYLVLEYCSQGDLYEAIRLGRGPLETEHVRQFMLELVSAVDYMHRHGLYHRDIKPENIFLTQDGSVKLGDFGLATQNRWSYESCVGSDRYMAPEQYDSAGNGYCPASADVWSIGICLLNVLFSRNPFVTPTDSDILFADFRRDRQSLFDVFPNMSQDTFEILLIALAFDPKKRDLAALRQAILRAVSFTTDDESLDDFCTEERDTVRASANREPLRTPSILTPQLNAGDFPWNTGFHTSPRKQDRQLSAIAQSVDEDLFPASEKGVSLGESWYTGRFNTPSMASVLDSAFGGSFKSMAIQLPAKRNPPRPDPVPIPNSLPIQASRPIPTMSSIFGKKDTVAKSWSEMFEEDEEESEREEAELQKRREQNSRSWSQESEGRNKVRPGVLTESKSHSSVNARLSHHSKPPSPTKMEASSNENDPFAWRSHGFKIAPVRPAGSDKWAALGDKRRGAKSQSDNQAVAPKKRSMTTGSRKKAGLGSTGYEYNGWNRRNSREKEKSRPVWLDQDWRQHGLPHKSSFEGSVDADDHEWVGGWHNFHL